MHVTVTQAFRLAKAGRRAEALTTSEEAVRLRRELVSTNRDAHLPDLATSLWMAGSVHLLVNGALADAVKACAEAVTLFDELVSGNADAYTGRRDGAARTLAKIHEAVGDERAAAEVRHQYGL